MTKSKFIKYMDVLIDKYKRLNQMYDAVEEITGAVPERLIETTNIQFAIDMLAEWVGDIDGWIDWFINEKECGKKKEMLVRDKDNNVLPSETSKDIWNLIMIDKGDV